MAVLANFGQSLLPILEVAAYLLRAVTYILQFTLSTGDLTQVDTIIRIETLSQQLRDLRQALFVPNSIQGSSVYSRKIYKVDFVIHEDHSVVKSMGLYFLFSVSGGRRKRDISPDSTGSAVQEQTIESADLALSTVALDVLLDLQADTSDEVFSNIYHLMQGLCAGVIQQEPKAVVDNSVSSTFLETTCSIPKILVLHVYFHFSACLFVI